MSEDKYKNKYRIPSARAAWHDYLCGAYFVTICTKERNTYLGKINDHQMYLSEIGEYADEQFRNVSMYYPFAAIPSYVIMPDHIHAIVIIDDRARNDSEPCIDVIHHISQSEALECVSEDNIADSDVMEGGATGRQNPMLYHCLGMVIRGLKARITHFSNEKGLEFAWQARFHDRIIRGQRDMNETAKYVADNIPKWPEDDECF